MLILTRKTEEGIILTLDGTEIMVRILGIDGERVKVGVDAPRNVQVLREELLPPKEQTDKPGPGERPGYPNRER